MTLAKQNFFLANHELDRGRHGLYVDLWKELFFEFIDKHDPIQHIVKKLFDRDNKKRKAVITKLNADWDEYNASRNKVNIALRQAKADYFRNKIATQNNNPKEA